MRTSKAFSNLANIACQTLLFVSVSLAMDNQGTLLSEREQYLAGNVGQLLPGLNVRLNYKSCIFYLY